MTWQLHVRQSSEGGICRFQIQGRLGSGAADELTQAFAAAIDQGERRLLIDFTDIDYVSSAGLLALDGASRMVRAAGGALVLFGVSEPVRLVFELSGLLPNFPVASSVEEATARLTAQA